MSDWIDSTAQWVGLSNEMVTRLIQTLTVLLIVLITRAVGLRLVRKRVKDVKRHYHWRRAINYACGFVLVLMISGIWVTGLKNSATFLGLITAGVAISLQDLLTNLAGWVFILTRRPFAVGDRIEVAGHIGDVIDVRLFQTYILECGNWVGADQSTGRVMCIPNATVFRLPSANYTSGFNYIWDEVPVLITFESNWKKAKQLLIQIAQTVAQPLSQGAHEQIRQAASKQMIFFQNLTPIVYTDVKDSGVLLTIRYLTPPRQRRGNDQRIWEAILDAFGRESDIDFAYPTARHYLNHLEGKPKARAHVSIGSPPPSGPPLTDG